MEKRLVRSTNDRRLGGVCGGLAEHFGIDPTLVRVGAVVAALMGWGLIGYLALWIALPEGETSGLAPSPAISIAEERFARGEISSEELEQIRRDLSGAA